MSEAIRTETAHPRRTVRSVGAVLAGIMVDVLLTIGTDLALHTARSLSGSRQTDRQLFSYCAMAFPMGLLLMPPHRASMRSCGS